VVAPLRELFRLSRNRRRLLLEAWSLVVLSRLSLWTLPKRTVKRALSASSPTPGSDAPQESIEQLMWAVSAAARRVPGASCLTQAIAATTLLARHGHRSTLRLGVRKDEQNRLHAHAWVESGERVVPGGTVDDFVTLPANGLQLP
jgi:hypothetical protein